MPLYPFALGFVVRGRIPALFLDAETTDPLRLLSWRLVILVEDCTIKG